ncbi:tripartite tricarboxylate transporter TctB family protein [Salsuginibacillus kocurii]|uniref:tripartite tricarboxylate transporter TctB family protein n=1 Tax=Salsuginibacillus kocurii TaxID=427078 RepID=UPI000372C942|nr:tripartite tricarboxylate transporter TctB family protein [Salsuginibacillus kocurii]
MLLKEQWRDVGVSGVLLGITLMFYIWTQDLTNPSDIFPKLVIALLLIFSLALLFKALFIKRAYYKEREYEASEVEDEEVDDNTEKVTGRKWAAIVVLIAFVYLIPVIGFYSVSFVFVTAFIWYLEGMKKSMMAFLRPVITAAGALIFIYFVFDEFLNIPIPDGIFF